MKNLFTLLILVALALGTYAQDYQKVRWDWSPFMSLAIDGNNGLGWGSSSELKFMVTDQFALGVKRHTFYHDFSFNFNFREDEESIGAGVSIRSGLYLIGDYYFNENKNRPYVSLGVGSTTFASVAQELSDEVVQEATISRGFSLAPGVGIDMHPIRIGLCYNLMASSRTISGGQTAGPNGITQSIDEKFNKGMNFLEVKVGLIIGGKNKKLN